MLAPVELRPLTLEHAEALLDLRRRNREHFLTGEPVRDDRFYTLAGQREQLRVLDAERAAGSREQFAILTKEGELAGYVSLGNIVRGAFRNAYLGYAVDRDHGGRGLATAAVGAAVEAAWAMGLHRVQANIATTNLASQRVIAKNRFRHEGTALRYLHLAGAWTDHHIYARTVEDG